MIWSWADSWEHNGRLPAAARQIEEEREGWGVGGGGVRRGRRGAEQRLQTVSAPSPL